MLPGINVWRVITYLLRSIRYHEKLVKLYFTQNFIHR